PRRSSDLTLTLASQVGERHRARLGLADNAPEMTRQIGPALLALVGRGVHLQERRRLAFVRQRDREAVERMDRAWLFDGKQLEQRVLLGALGQIARAKGQRHGPFTGEDYQRSAAVGNVLLQPGTLGQRQL